MKVGVTLRHTVAGVALLWVVFNLFQNAPIHSDRRFGNEIPPGKAGDAIVLEVLMDSIAGISACPQDLNPCNGFHPSPILARIVQD